MGYNEAPSNTPSVGDTRFAALTLPERAAEYYNVGGKSFATSSRAAHAKLPNTNTNILDGRQRDKLVYLIHL